MRIPVLLIAFAALLIPARAEPDATMSADFAWFGTLGFPEVKGLPFVRYCYATLHDGDGQEKELWSNGFLLHETPEKFRVLTFEFDSVELSKASQPTGFQQRFEPADLRAFAEAELNPTDPRTTHSYPILRGPTFTERTHRFVLAWMCARQGLDDLAAKLYAAAQTAQGPYARGATDDRTWPFRDKLDRDLGHFEMWRTIVAFGDPQVTRRELLARLRALPVHFPHCDHLARADSLAKRLEQMIAEDDAHPARTAAQIAALPPAEQAQEWLFRLRDQNGKQFSQPGWVDIFMTNDDSPAHQLVKLGDAAVPALIAALGDTRLTRSVGYGRDFFFSHEVITVGDAALTIIERIADRSFYGSGRIQGTMALDGQTDPVRAAVQAWWGERQTKGVRGELVEATATGEFSSSRAGAKLLADFPDAAATPILAGAAAAKREGERCEFIRLVGKLQDDRAPEFLLREAREGPFVGARAEAAWQLVKLGRADGIPPLVDLWRHSPPSDNPQNESGRRKLIDTLALSDSPEAIHALADGLHQRSPEARSHVLEALSPKRFSPMEFGDSPRPAGRAATSALTAAAIEDLIVAQLEDTGAYRGIHGSINGRHIDNPHLCDDAAALLAARWPDRYQFDIKASYPARERARIACQNVWRRAHDQPPLPPPPPRPPVAPGDESKIAEVVFAGDGISWPEPLRAVLQAASGQVLDAALFQKIEHTFLEACEGHAPDAHRGFYVEAIRDNATEGVTLVVAPVERSGLAQHPQRQWRVGYFAVLASRDQLSAESPDLFGKTPADADPKKVEEIFRKIAALPPGASFYLHLELAPQLWSQDRSF